MDCLLKKIYQNVILYEEDTIVINREIEEERSQFMECYKEKLSMEEVEELLDINPSHIRNIECGRVNPSLTILVKIVNILCCSVDCFISGEATFQIEKGREKTLENQIMEKLKYFDDEKKWKVLKIMELI